MINFYLSGNEVHDLVIEAFYEGCPEEKRLLKNFDYRPSDVAVIFGFFKRKIAISIPRGKVFSEQRSLNKDVIVLETGYINRGDGPKNHYAAGFNGLNGRADFKNFDMPPDRSQLLNINLGSWKKNGANILLIGQVPWDASVDHIEITDWLNDRILELKEVTDKPIIFRPHPLGKIPPFRGCGYSTGPLLEDLNNAHAVVTFSSNVGVDSTLYGVPVFVGDDGSMVKRVANTDLKLINHPQYPDRSQWLNDIAYTQWTPDEMREGLSWNHLFRS